MVSIKCTVTNVIGCAKSSSNVTFTAQASSSTLPVKTLTLKPSSDGRDAYITTAFGSFGTNFGYTPLSKCPIGINTSDCRKRVS